MNMFSDKRTARKFFLDKRLNLSAEILNLSSGALCQQILDSSEFKNADTVLLYHPTKNEPNLTPVAIKAWELGKHVAFPISVVNNYTLDFKEINSMDELTVGAYGILEPKKNAPSINISQNTLCFTPALAIDDDGYRLGYGKGYYDRFLQNFSGISVCAIFKDFICEKLPRQTTDVPINIIIFETGAVYHK